jgi:hypothetical protein
MFGKVNLYFSLLLEKLIEVHKALESTTQKRKVCAPNQNQGYTQLVNYLTPALILSNALTISAFQAQVVCLLSTEIL